MELSTAARAIFRFLCHQVMNRCNFVNSRTLNYADEVHNDSGGIIWENMSQLSDQV